MPNIPSSNQADSSARNEVKPTRTAHPASGPLIVGSSGASDSDAALVMAQVFEDELGLPVQVVTVVTHLPSSFSTGLLPQISTMDDAEQTTQIRKVQAQIKRVLDTDPEWPVSTGFGEAARVLAYEATARGAQLILAGRGRHTMGERLLGGEEVVRMLQLGETPVFATAAGLGALPDRVVVATDFSARSALAARTAISFIHPSSHVFLVTVMPDVEKYGGTWEHQWAHSYRAGLDAAFDNAIGEIARDGFTIEPVTLVGKPAEELVTFAHTQRANLVVCGTQGHGFFRRVILGSVASQLVRGVDCSVLCVPAHGDDVDE